MHLWSIIFTFASYTRAHDMEDKHSNAAVIASCISLAMCSGKYSKKLIGGIGSAFCLRLNPAITAYRLRQITHCEKEPKNNYKDRIRREATNYKLIQPIRGTSPELWELTELGKAICNDIMNEYNRRISERNKCEQV